MVVEPKMVRVEGNGQVTLPVEVRERLGLKEGDVVAVVETPDGVLITPQEITATRALDAIGSSPRDQGLTLEDLIESGRTERDDLIREQYGIDSTGQAT